MNVSEFFFSHHIRMNVCTKVNLLLCNIKSEGTQHKICNDNTDKRTVAGPEIS